MCVADCINGYILVDSYGIEHKKCRQNSGCNYDGGYEYNDPELKETICVSASVCKNHYNGYAYAKAQNCLSASPKDESEFDISDGVYTCKDSKYLFAGEDSTKCYTKQECPGYIDYYKCLARETCKNYYYETSERRECLSAYSCYAMSMLQFDQDTDNKLCISFNQCLEENGYVLTDASSKKCVTASVCSESEP